MELLLCSHGTLQFMKNLLLTNIDFPSQFRMVNYVARLCIDKIIQDNPFFLQESNKIALFARNMYT